MKMMKKLFSLTLCFVMMFMLAGCRITIDGEGGAVQTSVGAGGTIGLSVSTQNFSTKSLVLRAIQSSIAT